jgi:uncharacterized membrane protein YbhN (UPF0104 family)
MRSGLASRSMGPMLSPAPSPTTASRLHALRPAAVRAGLSQRVSSATEALMAHAQPSAAGDAALTARSGPMRLPRPSRRQVALLATAAAVAAALLSVSGGPMAELTEAFERALNADWGWAAAGVAFEAASFAGYVALFWLVAGRATRAIGARESAEISLSGAAATRLLPTGGLGGVALTLWALARAGLPARAAVRALLTFLVILYSVFMTALAVAGLALVTGVAPGDGPAALALVPALFGLLVIVAALRLGRGGSGSAFGDSVRGAVDIVRRFDLRLLGAPAWWGFDMAVLFATFSALGSPPPVAVLVLAYFTGAILNTVPLPGLVAGGTTGVLLAFGVDASLALPAVLAYRAIALWLPAALGAVAIAGLRRTAARWAVAVPERERTEDAVPPVAPRPVQRRPEPCRGARHHRLPHPPSPVTAG